MSDESPVVTHQRLLWWLARRFARDHPHLLPEDLVQAGSVAALRGLRHWTPDGHTTQESWIRVCAINGMRDHYRTEVRQSGRLGLLGEKDLYLPGRHEPDPWWLDPLLAEWVRAGQSRRCWGWRRRVVWYLFIVEDMTWVQIADLFKVSKQAVHQWSRE